MVGALHAPQRLRPRSAAVLLCNPFGEEAARAHRIYRVLATQLERSGFHVLRFDYTGTGDSAGESDEVSVARWIGDIGIAAEQLLARSGARKLVAIGLRLGGTLAALATARGELRLRHLVMWDPVVDGGAYLRELAAQHRSYMRSELGEQWRDRLRVSADGVPAEALGVPIRPELAAELAAIDLRALSADELRTDHATVIRTGRGGDAALAERLRRPPVHWIELPASEAWNSDAALNAAVVPMDVVQAIVTRVEELSP